MIGSRTFGRNEAKAAKVSRAARPTLEGLEDRMLLYATDGGIWHFPSRVTYSFVPDKTSIGGVPSNLFSTLNSYYPTATWQTQFKQAFATWEDQTAINIAQVNDNGEPYDAYGNQQGDPNVGDIRISMINMGDNGELAIATLPPPVNGGTNAGDIVFNSYYYWGINNGNYDIQSVALHEIGHALGLAHTGDTNAVMYPWYTGVNQNPDADDVQGIESLYGPSGAMNESNRFKSGAKDITWMIQNNQIDSYNLSINGPTDGNWYSVTVPKTTNGTMTVSMQTTNLSSLSPGVQVYNSAQQGGLLGQSILTNQWGATATVTIKGVTPGQTYYIFTGPATSPGTWGAYALLVNFGKGGQAAQGPPNTVVAWAPDQGGGSLGLGTGSPIGRAPGLLPGASPDPTGSTPVLPTDGKPPKDSSGTKTPKAANTDNGNTDNGKKDPPQLIQLGFLTIWGDAYRTPRPHDRSGYQTHAPRLLHQITPGHPGPREADLSSPILKTTYPAAIGVPHMTTTPESKVRLPLSHDQTQARDEALTQWVSRRHAQSNGSATVALATRRHTRRPVR